MPAVFANLAASRSQHISSPKIAQLRLKFSEDSYEIYRKSVTKYKLNKMDSIGKIDKTIMACPECHHEIDVAIETDSDGFFVCPICSKTIKFSKEAKAASDLPESSAASRKNGVNKLQDRFNHGFDEELFLCGVIGVSIGTFAPSISLWQTLVGAFLTTFFGVILKSRHHKRYVDICTRLGIEESRSLYWFLTMFKNSLFILIFLTILKWFNGASLGASS